MGTTKYKIAYFHQDGSVTGSAISLSYFLSAINKNIFEPVVILAKDGPARKLYESLNITVKVHHYHTFWTFPGPMCLSSGMIKQLRAFIPNVKLKHFVLNEIKPDLIHINDKAAINIGISLKGAGIPIVQHSRSSYVITACAIGKYLSANSIKGYANHIICISEDEEDGFETLQNKSIVYNTVDFSLIKKAKDKRSHTREQLGVKSDEILIGFAAHVSQKKGAWDFLDICKQLKFNKKLKFILSGKLEDSGHTLIGNGQKLSISPKEYVRRFIQENKLGNQLIVTGFREDILDVMAAMDILVVPNKNGVLGRQPIEAQALGILVIAQSGHSKRSKIIQHGETGFLIQSIQQGIEQIKKVLANEENTKISKSAESYAEQNFNPITNIKKIESIYLSLLSN